MNLINKTIPLLVFVLCGCEFATAIAPAVVEAIKKIPTSVPTVPVAPTIAPAATLAAVIPAPIATTVVVIDDEPITEDYSRPGRPERCDLIKFDGLKWRFLVLRSNTDKRNIKLLTPGLYTTSPVKVYFKWKSGDIREVKPCSSFLANPDIENGQERPRGHYCYTGKMPDSVIVGGCPELVLGEKCKKKGRCD